MEKVKYILVNLILVLFLAPNFSARADERAGRLAQTETNATGDRVPVFAFKTNALYDLATVLNASFEVPIGKNVSLLCEGNFPWWLTKNNRYCLQVLSLGAEARWWFAPQRDKREALNGHFLGAYIMSGTSDLQYRRYLCYQSQFVSAGLSYGYSMKLSNTFNLEFSISAGYARIPYQHYIPSSDYSTLFRDNEKCGELEYFGPTRVGVSLVLPIRATKKAPKSHTNYNSNGGGAR